MTDHNLRNNIWNFYLDIEMPGIWYFNHVRTLKRIELYFNGKFEKGEYDSRGNKKYFYNITKPSCDVASKFMGLETKDIILVPEHEEDEELLWLMRQDLREWMKENKFDETLAEIRNNLPKYGSVVLKKDKTEDFHNVRLLNLRFDVATNFLENSHFVSELLMMNEREMHDMKGWDQAAIGHLLSRGRVPKSIVYENYYMNTDPQGKKWKREMRGDLFTYYGTNSALIRTVEARINQVSDYIPSILLYEDEVDELPYREVHFERVPGRWLGLGFPEYLFDNQIRRNEVTNKRARGLDYTALHIYQTKDQTVGNNILTDMENGDILKVTSEVQPISNEERNLAYFNDEAGDWDKNAAAKTFSTDVAKGENLPSRTPIGVANMQLGMVSSFFDERRAIVGMFLREAILTDIIPRFKDEIAPKHKLMFAGSPEEMERMSNSVAKAHVWQQAWEFAVEKGYFPDQGEIDSEVARIKKDMASKKGFEFDIPNRYYEDAKYKADIITTGEQVDTASVKQTLMTVMQIVSTNPAALQDPALRSMVFMMMELSGVDPVEMDLLKTAMQQAQQQQQQQPPVQGGAPGPQGVPQGAPQGQPLRPGGSIVVPKALSNPALVPKRQIL